MARYVDADLIKAKLKKSIINSATMFINTVLIGLIDEAPTADVVEVKHGEWIYHECVSTYDGCKSGNSCSACNAFVDEEAFDANEFHEAF